MPEGVRSFDQFNSVQRIMATVRQPMTVVFILPDGLCLFNQSDPALGTMATALQMPVFFNTISMAIIARDQLDTGELLHMVFAGLFRGLEPNPVKLQWLSLI